MNHKNVPIPNRLKSRPLDEHGFVVTYITTLDPKTHKPDFRIIDHARVSLCLKHKLCGLCGKELEKLCAFIGGNESVKCRMFSDPAMHLECARYAIQVCPYLANSNADRGPAREHEGIFRIEHPLAGKERPQKMALYISKTKEYKVLLVAAKPGDMPAPAIKAGKPFHLEWF